MLCVNYISIKIKLNLINEIKLSELEKKKRLQKKKFSLKETNFTLTVCFTAQMTIINSMNFQGICSHSLHRSNTCGRCIPKTCKQNKSFL